MPALSESIPAGRTGPIKAQIQICIDEQSPYEFLALNRQLYQFIFGDQLDDSERIVSLKLLGSNIFHTSKLYPVVYDTELAENYVELHSARLLARYGADFTLDKCLILPVSTVVPLTRAILSFPPEVYNLLEQYPKQKLLEILADEIGGNVHQFLVHQNDVFNTLHGTIIHCEPVDQGYITPSTHLIISKQSNLTSSPDKPSIETIPVQTPLASEELPSVSDFELEKFGIDSSSIFDSTIFQPLELKTALLEHNTLANYTQVYNSSSEFDHEDNQLFVCVRSNELEKLGCFSGDVVQLTSRQCDCASGLLCACANRTDRTIYVRVFPFIDPNTFEYETIHISPMLLNTIGNPRTVTINRIKDQEQRADLPRNKIDKFVPLAKEIVIARVASPVTLDRTMQHLFLSNLKSYFEERYRVIMKDQLVPIPIDALLARALFSTYEASGDEFFPKIIPTGLPTEIAWFKITGGSLEDESGGELVNGQQYVIDPSKTRMIQSGVCTEKIGLADGISYQQIRDFYGLPKMFSFPNFNLSNSITFPYAQQLRKIVDTAFRIRNKFSSRMTLQTTILLNSMVRCVGKSMLVRSIATEFGANLLELDSFELFNQSSASKTIGTIRGKADRVVDSCNSLIILIRHIDALAKKPDPNQQQKDTLALKLVELIDEYTAKGAIVIATTNDADNMSESLRSKLKFEINLNVPTEPERKLILEYLLEGSSDVTTRQDVSLDTLSLQSAGLTANDLMSIVENAKKTAIDRLEDLSVDLSIPWEQVLAFDGGKVKLGSEDFEKAINSARNKFSDLIGAPRIPDVKWEDVGGLDVVKDEILDTIELPLKHPELFSKGMKKRSGILFYGPPGTGKTLLAKAIATNFALNFFSVKGPELLNMYIGESEANVRRVFQKARDAKPCVIFFDELDSVAPKRGNQGDSGGVMDRIVSQLLAELDGMSGAEGGDGVFVVGATNRPDLLDEALLRPGRFDKMLYLGISDTHEKQAKIIQALTRKFELESSVDLQEIADSCPFTYTGADFYALCSDAMLNAMTRTAGVVENKIIQYNDQRPEGQKINIRYWFDNIATPEDIKVHVTTQDFTKARQELIPSVSAEELDHYLSVRRSFESGKAQENGHSEAHEIVINQD
ncbi:hypothetical protein OGAPHI_004866 [Ogataea philodendri]|uniref:Peroxisomal ATPase PEX6 n=1 Tax=Ogataea philodendri TaxID=1378263 RepID=A0A9P8P3G2_9ASCO|nr:uncharacterized protein OGAPHI_004866 [Ogataea philodendri]KAH3664152.1 hypothetical protein OGAPHI_004866 [Ogataea philodendri]